MAKSKRTKNPPAGTRTGEPKKTQAKPAQKNAANKSSTAGKRSRQGANKAAQSAPSAAPAGEKSKRSRNTSGFADTKEYPHKKHPARFKKKRGSDDIEYITFTHSKEVELGDVVVVTIPLESNINPKERGTLNEKGEPNISHVLPKVFVGKRSALGKGTDKYSLVEADKKTVDKLFATLPREQVPKKKNTKKKSKK